MKKLLLFPLIIFSCQSFASEQDKLAKYNTDVSKSIRQSHADKLAQTTYREINVKDARVSDDISKVYPQIETKVTKDGSATRVVAEAVLNTDKEKVAKDWAKKLNTAAKFGTGVLGSAALGLMVNELLDAIDYVMGEGGQVLKKVTPDDPLHPSAQYYYVATSYVVGAFGAPDSTLKFTSQQAVCNYWSTKQTQNRPFYGITVGSNGTFSCGFGADGWYTASGARRTNPNYNSGADQPTQPASETDIKDAIKSKVLDKASTDPTARNLAKNLVKESYARIWDDKGNSLEIRGDVTNKQKDILNSNDPTSDGHTTSTPSISDGKSGSGSSSSGSSSSGTSEGTTFNPDGSVASSSVTTTTTTSTSTTNIEFELPAFCDWATTVCDWLDWTQEEPELTDTPLEIEEREFTPYQFEEHVRFAQTCPFSPETVSLPMGAIGELEFQTDLTFICDWGHNARPYIQGLGYLGSLIFLLYGLRSGNG